MRTRTKIVLAVWCGVALLGGAAHVSGVRFNDTESAPTGLWRLTPAAMPLQRGALVSICPPDVPVVRAMAEGGHLPLGKCSAGTATLLKPIAAVAGDTVTVTLNGVAVNGFLLPNTSAHPDVLGFAPMRPGRYLVTAGHAWLLSSYSPDSFDSRYFGPVTVASAEGIARPLVVRGDVSSIYGGPR
jgi:conjugative transfer signal peptidase TraF